MISNQWSKVAFFTKKRKKNHKFKLILKISFLFHFTAVNNLENCINNFFSNLGSVFNKTRQKIEVVIRYWFPIISGGQFKVEPRSHSSAIGSPARVGELKVKEESMPRPRSNNSRAIGFTFRVGEIFSFFFFFITKKSNLNTLNIFLN